MSRPCTHKDYEYGVWCKIGSYQLLHIPFKLYLYASVNLAVANVYSTILFYFEYLNTNKPYILFTNFILLNS